MTYTAILAQFFTSAPDHIVLLIFVAIIAVASLGIISGIYALYLLWLQFRRLRGFKRENESTSMDISILRANQHTLSERYLLDQRLRDIIKLFSRRTDASGIDPDSKNIAPPSIQDLHLMTELQMEGNWAAKVLHVTTSVLLICGICGTLFGVHSALGSGGVPEIHRLGDAMQPSKWAILGTILLLALRGFYLYLADKFLSKLDRYTLTRILPELAPATDIATSLKGVGEAVNTFSHKVGDIATASGGMKKAASDFETAVNSFKSLETLIKSVEDTVSRVRINQKALNKNLKRSNTLISQSETTRANLNRIFDNFEKKSTSLSEQWKKLENHITQEISQIDQLKVEVDSFKNQAKELQEECPVEDYKKEADAFKKSVEKISVELKNSTNDLKNTSCLIDITLNNTAQSNQKLSLQLSDVDKSLKESTEMQANLKNINKEWNDKLNTLSSSMDHLDKNCNESIEKTKEKLKEIEDGAKKVLQYVDKHL